MEYAYSSKDSNRNRKIEQAKAYFLKIIAVAIALSASVAGCYYYYNFTTRPSLQPTPKVVQAPPQTLVKTNDAHTYHPELAPFEQ